MGPGAQELELRWFESMSALTAESVPETARAAVRTLVLDHLACRVHGLTLPWTGSAWRAVRDLGMASAPGPGEHGPQESGLFAAALLGGTAAHGFDFDDTHLPTMTHPGAVVVPAVEAAARMAPGGDAIASIIAGYEVMARITAALGREFGERGFHATGQVGAMAAAVGAARQLGLGPVALSRAVGAAASMGSGTKAFVNGPGNIKRLHAGLAAAHGLLAAVLELRGLSGPDHALTGRFGFLAVHGSPSSPGPAVLLRGNGAPYVVEEVHLKRFPACAAVHGAVLAASRVGPLDSSMVEAVRVRTSARALAQNCIPRPSDVLTAQYSTEFAVATALLGDPSDPAPYVDPTAETAREVRRLAERVSLVEDPRAEAVYPSVNAAEVEVVLRDGRRLVEYAEVSADQPPAWSDADAKFERLTAPVVEAGTRQRVVESIRTFESGHDLTAALAALPVLPIQPPVTGPTTVGLPAESAVSRA